MALKGRTFSLEHLKLDNLYATYLGLSTREQTMALVMVAAAILFIIVLPVTLASRSMSSLERGVAEGQAGLKKIARQIESYNAAKGDLERLEKSLAGGFDSSIATTLESLADKAGIKDHIDSLKEKPMAPSDLFEQVSVDVRLTKVRLKQFISFLFEIEHHPMKILKLQQLDIKPRYDSKQELDASFTVSTFRLRESVTGEAP